jgi:thymidine phosphorylase
MVTALGGPADFVEKPEGHLPAAPVIRDVFAREAGVVAAVDTRAIGIAVVELGGGRMRAADPIDHSVGFTALAGLGAAVDAETPLARVHARDEAAATRAEEAVRAAYRVGETAPEPAAVVYERLR